MKRRVLFCAGAALAAALMLAPAASARPINDITVGFGLTVSGEAPVLTLAVDDAHVASQVELDSYRALLASVGAVNAEGNPVSWTQLKDVPSGFADGVDDGLTSISWGDVTGRPAGLDDGDDVGITALAAGTGIAVSGTGESRTVALAASEPWHVIGAPGEPAFGAGWGNFGGGWPSAAYYKDSAGVVHLRGAITKAEGVLNVFPFALPAGYRPHAIAAFGVAALEFGVAWTAGVFHVRGDGWISYASGLTLSEGVDLVDLTGISFRAEG